jgi:calcium binding protein 39
MTRYISSADNLKLMMNLLRDKSRNIQFEAFHVFKVFVANPHKTRPIVDILVKNQDKLIHFLGNFHNDRQGKRGHRRSWAKATSSKLTIFLTA